VTEKVGQLKVALLTAEARAFSTNRERALWLKDRYFGSVRNIAAALGTNKSTVSSWTSGKVTHDKPGRPPLLSPPERKVFHELIDALGNRGKPPTIDESCREAAKIIAQRKKRAREEAEDDEEDEEDENGPKPKRRRLRVQRLVIPLNDDSYDGPDVNSESDSDH